MLDRDESPAKYCGAGCQPAADWQSASPWRPEDLSTCAETSVSPYPERRLKAGGKAVLLCLLCALSAQGATFGKVVPLLGGSADIVLDEARNQIYFTSSTENYVQVYSIAKQVLSDSHSDRFDAAFSRYLTQRD